VKPGTTILTYTYGYVNGNPLSGIDALGLDTYKINRDLAIFWDTASSINNPITHTFIVTTNPDGSVNHTYSWGNEANLKGWNLDQSLDRKTAAEALRNKQGEYIGDADFDPFVNAAFKKLNKKLNEHANKIIYDNCKTESTNLINTAKRLYPSSQGR
jgi:hypothetical protein